MRKTCDVVIYIDLKKALKGKIYLFLLTYYSQM